MIHSDSTPPATGLADHLADYMATRNTPWADYATMREAVHETVRLMLTEALPDVIDARVERLEAAILDIDAHATPFGEDEDGFVTGGYLISVGSLHRALGIVGRSAAKVRKR